MNKQWVGACAMILLGGCASVEMAQYTWTSFAEVPLKGGARVKIVANNDGLGPIVGVLAAAFDKSGSFTVVDDNADYWFVLSSLSDYESAQETKLSVVAKENERAVWQDFNETARNLESAAMGVSVAVYDVKTLAPVHYFEIPHLYGGNNTSKAVRGRLSYEKIFARKVVARVMAAFVSQKKQVKIAIPLDADEELRKRFIEGGMRVSNGEKEAYRPFRDKYQQLGGVDLPRLCEQLRTKTYEGSDADAKLCNCFLSLLVEEASTLDPEVLAGIKKKQLMILAASDNRGLAEAVPVALARLEYKLANLGK